MSKHRESVLLALDRLQSLAAAALTFEVVEGLLSADVHEVTIDLLDATRTSSAVQFQLSTRLQAALSEADIGDLRSCDLTIVLRTRSRESRCAAPGGTPNVRTMLVTAAAVRTRLRTRWVDMWRDSQKEFESPHTPAEMSVRGAP